MIKFFRKIRQKLLSENKFSKYLIYAIGEIILVVVGILLALAINNQNELRKDKNAEQKLLKQLLIDYESNYSQLQNKIDQRTSIMRRCNELLDVIDKETKIHPDSLPKIFATFLLDPTFDPIDNDVIASGSIRLLKNDILKEMISKWHSDAKAYQETEQVQHDDMISSTVPFLKRVGLMRNASFQFWSNKEFQIGLIEQGRNANSLKLKNNEGKIDVDYILYDQELEGLLSYIFHISLANNLEAESLKTKMLKTIKILKMEIE
ncbi:MAG: DUF6090 family protein [Flavobacteriales bacterium]|jgi:hypothetical protein|nr:DUF6090 family protein [Flavobacteriales bacterium]